MILDYEFYNYAVLYQQNTALYFGAILIVILAGNVDDLLRYIDSIG